MNEAQLRKNAAELARDIRRIPLLGNWTRKQWNDKVRVTIRHYLANMRRFFAANKED